MATTLIATRVAQASLDGSAVEALRRDLVAQRKAQAGYAAEFEATAAELGGSGGTDSIVAREIAEASAVRVRQVIEEIDAALARIDDGTFGTCELCRALVPVRRLEAVPHARFCVSCAESRGGALG